jgi:hypothetical protein
MMRFGKLLPSVLLFAGFSIGLQGCASNKNLHLDASPGQGRLEVEKTLKSAKYCRKEAREQGVQSYTRCNVKGFEMGDSWVVVHYRQEQVTRVERMESFSTHTAATERWSELVEEHSGRLGAESEEARAKLSEMGELPVGAMTWKVWRHSGAIVALFLIKPADPKDPRVIELILED